MMRLLRLITLTLCIAMRAGAQTPPFLHAGDQSLLHFNNGNYSFTYHVMMTGQWYLPNDLLFYHDSLVAHTFMGNLFSYTSTSALGNGNILIHESSITSDWCKGYYSYLLPLNGYDGLFITIFSIPGNRSDFTEAISMT